MLSFGKGSSSAFLSTSPAWGTTAHTSGISARRWISIHVPRVGDDALADALTCEISEISIHVPRVGDDRLKKRGNQNEEEISIHVPRVGDDGTGRCRCIRRQPFLSTSPAWGTTGGEVKHTLTIDISIHVPRVGDDKKNCGTDACLWHISIHVPRVGDDANTRTGSCTPTTFLSTSPAWGTTRELRHNVATQT